MKQILKRHLALMAVLWMVLSSACAERATSIFVATDRHATYETEKVQENQKAVPVRGEDGSLTWHNHLTEVLEKVREDDQALQPSAVLLGGDFVGEGADSALDGEGNPIGQPAFTMEEVQEEIRSVLGDGVRTFFTYGSHDLREAGAYSDVFLSGPAACDGYYIYGISYSQMIYGTDAQAAAAGYTGKDLDDPNGISAESASRNFLEWVSGLSDHQPIIFMTHVPMHANRGDNLGTKYWLEALKTACEDHDIIVVWGHNHSSEDRKATRKVEQAVYLVPRGGTMSVQTWTENEKGEAVIRQKNNKLMTEKPELGFTYMNAGYITLGFGTLLTFRDVNDDGTWDEVQFKRYSISGDGEAEFGMTGLPSPYVLELRSFQ
ncbi:MAG: metallophosphoesterase [Clostridia bacterium]|nr:metallophosphoesterase [Clostridia bacterium]